MPHKYCHKYNGNILYAIIKPEDEGLNQTSLLYIMSAGTSDSLPIENGSDLLIVLLYSQGASGTINEPIEGITRLQKLMFLLRQGIGPEKLVNIAESYGYKPYKMGPYSDDLNADIEELISAGIIHSEQLKYWIHDDSDNSADLDPDIDAPSIKKKKVISLKFSLTSPLGIEIGKDLWETLKKEDKAGMTKFKSFFNSLSLRQLLIFAYEKFPEFTTKSIIKGQLGLG